MDPAQISKALQVMAAEHPAAHPYTLALLLEARTGHKDQWRTGQGVARRPCKVQGVMCPRSQQSGSLRRWDGSHRPWSAAMSFDQAVVDLSAAVAQQLQSQLGALMAEAQESIRALEQQLAEERQRREQVEQQLDALQHSHTALQQELELERQARSAADQQVETIHAAIAEQLELAEAEHAAEQAARAEQERCWSEQQKSLRAELQQERQWREQLQQRIETLRQAAAALLVDDLPGAALPQPLLQPLTIHASGDGLLAGSGARL